MALEWYCAQTYPLREATARRRLDRQDFPVYLPMETVRKVIKGEILERQEPLFPTYLFVQLDRELDDRWKRACTTKAVMRLLPCSERPEAIPHYQVERLQDFEEQGFFKRGAVRPGERVKVWRGTLADQVLEVLESHNERIKCLWNCFGAPRVIQLRLSEVMVLH